MGTVVIFCVESGINPKSGEVRGYFLHDVADYDSALVPGCIKVFRGKCTWPRFVEHGAWPSPTGKTGRRLSTLGAIQFLGATVLRSSADHSIVHYLLHDLDDLIVRLAEIDRKPLTPLLMGTSVTANRQY